jgi:hypothetical protein
MSSLVYQLNDLSLFYPALLKNAVLWQGWDAADWAKPRLGSDSMMPGHEGESAKGQVPARGQSCVRAMVVGMRCLSGSLSHRHSKHWHL